MSFKRAITYSVAINLFFLALCLVFGDLKFGAIDDYFMAARLSGALGTDYNPHLIFVNAIYGYALLPLYHLFPEIGWYYIGEMLSVFLSFTVIGYVLLQRCGERWGAILAALFTALFASDFYLVVQFTQCASILSAAGMLLFAYGVVEYKRNCDCRAPDGARNDIKKTVPFALGVLLMLWGSVMRWQAFLMGMPFFCLGMLFIFKDCWKVKWRVIAGLAILFAGAFAMHSWDQKIYQAPEYADFVKFQGPRVTFGDNGNYNQNAVYEDAEELGLSGKDMHMLSNWIMYDTEVFSVDSIKQYSDLIPPYRTNNPKELIPRDLLNALAHSLRSPLFWTWFILCLLIYATNRKRYMYLWLSLATVLALVAYLLAMGRLVYRVESGFWLYAAVLAIPLFGKFTLNVPHKLVYSILAIIAAANIFIYATSGEMVRDPSSGAMRTLAIEDTTDYMQVFDYIDSQPDKMFLLSMNAFMRFSHHRNPPYLAEPIGQYRRTVSFGYWTPYLPEVTNALNDFGVANPIKDVVHDNVIVLNEPHLVDFLQRHYYDSVAVDTLREIGEMTFLKYRLVQPTDSATKEAE
ncbi:hypothetical protein [Fibrobacter sp. UWR2]|uniref:hypothetical protein n=1 Tax=Fibrobacter sp. UWR2 TaxID=1964352 RepID=UPI000B52415D|nr:hypothetical protein [Fibrobacter sp. UWR2]OWV00767.1 hypothetical protein B7994_06915 [Fibrobacter sp. UWR2]